MTTNKNKICKKNTSNCKKNINIGHTELKQTNEQLHDTLIEIYYFNQIYTVANNFEVSSEMVLLYVKIFYQSWNNVSYTQIIFILLFTLMMYFLFST